MNQLFYLLPVLACPVGMGVMMWFMMRSRRSPEGQAPQIPPTAEQEQELTRLRKEIEALRGEAGPRADLRKERTP